MTETGAKVHEGQCRKGKPQAVRDACDAVVLAEEGESEHATPAPIDEVGSRDATPEPAAQPGPAEAGPAPNAAPKPFNPFPSAGDEALARMYVRRFDLSVGTLDAILGITHKSHVQARCTDDLLEYVDKLPGLSFSCAELCIPGYAAIPYRLFFRTLPASVDFMLRKHGSSLLKPELVPHPIPEEFVISEMWQGRRYQAAYRKFRARPRAQAGDILLPLIFFSGARTALLYLHSLRRENVTLLCSLPSAV